MTGSEIIMQRHDAFLQTARFGDIRDPVGKKPGVNVLLAEQHDGKSGKQEAGL